MSAKTKIIPVIFAIAILISVASIYYRYLYIGNFSYNIDDEAFTAALDSAEQ